MESLRQVTDVLLQNGEAGKISGTLIFWGILALVNLPIYILYGKLIFGDFENFMEAVGFWLTPDIFSILDGSHWEDFWAEMKLGAWVFLCVVTVVAEGRFLIPMLLES